MNFLSPTSIAIAAGLTIPPLVALYFLKLKRTVHVVPSTLLWKKAIEDLHVNSPFQRLRASLLLLLQLLVLLAGVFALGKPMLQTTETPDSTAVLLVDQSASMAVVEQDGRSRLDSAKEQARLFVDNMPDDARAMVIAFSDQAHVVSPFDTNKRALKQRIDAIGQTASRTNLAEAISLAEAYTQNMIIGRRDEPDIEMRSDAPPATVVLLTDGRIEDAGFVALQKFDVERIQVISVGKRGDNVGVLTMSARRHYERPEMLEVAATVANFGDTKATVDVALYVAGRNVDIKSIELGPGEQTDAGGAPGEATPPSGRDRGGPESTGVVVFDDIEYAGGGLVEVVLQIDDALATDDRAWTLIDEPRRSSVLLVTRDNMLLTNALSALAIDLEVMSPEAYESADDNVLTNGERSLFDVVMFDGHGTQRLPLGNYMFWGAVPMVEGVSAGDLIDTEIIFNWDDTHPILRHVAVETIHVYEWLKLVLPPDAISIMDGETSPVMAYLARDGSQFLISAFRLIHEDSHGISLNTYWCTTVDFIVFMQNAVQFLSSNVATTGRRSVSPGEPVTVPVPLGADEVRITRPDGRVETIPVANHQAAHYADTRQVGTYHVEPGVAGYDTFAVNLFNANESHIEPVTEITLGTGTVTAKAGAIEVNEPAWPWFLLAALLLLLLEWIVYNQRVFV